MKIFETDHDFIRSHLLKGVFPPEAPPPDPRFQLDQLAKTEWSPGFEELMRNRLVLGAFRYGLLDDPTKPQWDRMTRIKQEVERYMEGGNLECLVDIANMALLEFVEGKHPKRHFKASDGGLHCQIKKGRRIND